MKRFLLLMLMAALCLDAAAQTTKVRGRVTDVVTGEGVPFAGVYFKGTTIGLTTDMDGYYSLEVRDVPTDTLICQQLGYVSQEKKVVPGIFTRLDFQLRISENYLNSVVVKADNRKIRRLLANIEAHRDRNNPERRRNYSCEIFNKTELGIANAREQLTGRQFRRQFAFVFDYMDTSAVSGIPYLPAMISESKVKRFHTSDPDADSEIIEANRISGVNPDNNLLSQFTGSLHLKNNFYDPFVNSFDVELPSPIQNGGLLYYNYYIVDTLQVDGRKTYLVHYHPKQGISTPALDGEMQIDAEDFALRSIHARMKHGGNVNWLRDLALDAEYKRLPDSTWFYSKSKLYADFSVVLADSSKVLALLGTRELYYSTPSFDAVEEIPVEKVKVDAAANHYGEEYWKEVRPYRLSKRENDIYEMVDRFQSVPLYDTYYDIAYTLVNGYWDISPIGIGPYFQLISFNNLEGVRLQMGIHTSKDLSRKFRWTAYLAYGFKDRMPKGGLTYERLFSKEPTRKLTIDARYDVFQLGRGKSEFTDGNILASVMGKSKAQKLCPMTSFSAMYEHEVNANLNLQFDLAAKRYFSNAFVPMVSPGGLQMGSVASNEIHFAARFSKDETVNRGYFIKSYIHTDKPVVTLELTGGIPGIRKNDCGFLRPELTLDWKFRIPPVGMSKIHFNAGTLIGRVPYPLLHLFEGNGTYVMDKTAFSCMDFFEFAADSWATLFWHHTFGGFFLGKIPLLNKLQLREEFTFKGAFGHLSDKNNALLPGSQAQMAFPDGMKTMGNVPYIEIGAGISNIFRLVRVDCNWRLTHRENARQVFCVTAGLEFRF